MPIAVGKCLLGAYSLFRNPSSVIIYSLSNTSQRKFSNGQLKTQEIVPDFSKAEDKSQEVFDKVNEQINNKSHGRLFAVVQVQGTQFKITTEDIILVRNNFAPTLGDKIRLEKVLLVGSSDFTLIGRPLLPMDQVSVIATVIEKTLTHTIAYLNYRPRKNNLRRHFYKDELTFLRINSINILGKVNELGDTDGLKDRIFEI